MLEFMYLAWQHLHKPKLYIYILLRAKKKLEWKLQTFSQEASPWSRSVSLRCCCVFFPLMWRLSNTSISGRLKQIYIENHGYCMFLTMAITEDRRGFKRNLIQHCRLTNDLVALLSPMSLMSQAQQSQDSAAEVAEGNDYVSLSQIIELRILIKQLYLWWGLGLKACLGDRSSTNILKAKKPNTIFIYYQFIVSVHFWPKGKRRQCVKFSIIWKKGYCK